MNDIKNILVCPECKCELTNELKCKNGSHQYSYKYGVYNIVSPALSANQEILWKNTDEMLEGDINTQNQQPEENSWVRDYQNRKNQETKNAERQIYEYMVELINGLSGDVCDLATGMGGMLQMLLNSPNKNFNIVCTDISDKVLAWTRKIKKTDDSRVFYIATDGRYMSIKNNSFDYITSIAAFGNIPESDKVAKELYRILKPSGKLIIQGSYILKDTKSYEIAKSLGLERGLVEEYLIEDLKNAGFEDVISNVVAEAVWAENPYDRIPAAGDINRYCVIQACKKSQ
jgi:SAM-dependent methyltransferase